MSGSHGHAIFVHALSPLHRLAPHLKIAAGLVMLGAIISTPQRTLWASAVYGLALAALVIMARLPIRFVLSRMLVLTPFALLALMFPVFGADPRVEVLGISLSEPGLWDMWNLLAKTSLGLSTAILLGATTEMADLLRGLDSLRVPRLVTAILGFMVRYIDVVVDDLNRMRLALAARGHGGSSIAHWGPYGRAMGTMFIRTYERGERVYLAMESRGYAGEMPASARAKATPEQWAFAILGSTAFWAVAITARIVT